MSRAVWKYPLSPGNMLLCNGKMVLAGTDQNGATCVWMEVEPDKVSTEDARTFTIFGTGHKIDDGWRHEVSFIQGQFVWHVYSMAPVQQSRGAEMDKFLGTVK